MLITQAINVLCQSAIMFNLLEEEQEGTIEK